MHSTVRATLGFAALLALALGGAYLYATLFGRQAPDPVAPNVSIGPDLSDEIEAGIEAAQKNDFALALRHFEAVPRTDPGYLVALQNLISVRARLGDFEASLSSCEELNRLQPDDPDLLVLLSWAQYRMGRYADAELSTLRALELAPDHKGARFNVGLYRVAQGQLPAAVMSYHRAMARDAEGSYLTHALEDLLKLHEARPDLPDTHYALAFFAKTLSRRELEIEELEHYLALAPTGQAAEIARARLAEARAGSAAR